LHTCSPDSDIYPLLAHADALVTDYSSIYMDYLLLDRPVLFLIPDGDSYMRNDRQVQFDLTEMMPGPIAASWPELLESLEAQWAQDSHAEERRVLCNKAFDGLSQNDATSSLIEFMRKQDWLPTVSNEKL
jgi:CDP-glycerol glycerophosphotransferase (TagB/SpsB family)